MLNRDLLIVRYKQPFVDWINEADPNPDGEIITLEDANDDPTTFLIHEYASEEFEGWLAAHYGSLFETVLEEWYTDPDLWPRDRSLERFNAWCDCQVHSLVLDYVGGPLVDDEA